MVVILVTELNLAQDKEKLLSINTGIIFLQYDAFAKRSQSYSIESRIKL